MLQAPRAKRVALDLKTPEASQSRRDHLAEDNTVLPSPTHSATTDRRTESQRDMFTWGIPMIEASAHP